MALDAISPVNGFATVQTTAAAAATETRGSDALGRNEFLQLLAAQLRFQNPLEPTDGTQFVAQLATFSSLEGIERLNASFTQLFQLQQLTQGASLIGKEVTFSIPGSTQLGSGLVTELTVLDGQVQLLVNGTAISLDQIRSLALP
jgi:flagellar basal-body rod modification protein FlgD